MKKLLTTFALLATLTAGAQTYSVRPERRYVPIPTDTLQNESYIFKAGKALRKSACYDVASWGLTVASAISFAGIGDGERRTYNTLGITMAIGAVACKILSVSYKIHAGTQLMLAPGKVTVTF